MADNAGTPSVQQLAASALEVPFEHLIVGRIESEFPWLKNGGIVWARTVDFKSALFWVRNEGPPIWLNPPELKGLPGLSVMLTTSVGELPGEVKPIPLAEAVRKLSVEPRGYVASQEFLKKHTPYLSSWLMKDTEAARKQFAAQCSDPILAKLQNTDKPDTPDNAKKSDKPDANAWKLTFSYFNPQGGVEKWVVIGDAAHVASAKKDEALPDGTYRWPFR